MKKISLLFVAILGNLTLVFSQSEMQFPETSYDFGMIYEGGQPSHTFDVRNTGNEGLLINNVAPSCGCTTPQWSKNAIEPNQTGSITASYNSSGRIGPFFKSINIQSNAKVNPKTIYIKGVVVKKDDTLATKEEMKLPPVLEIERVNFTLGKLEKGRPALIKLNIKNTGKSPLKIFYVQSGCMCTSIKGWEPLKPGASQVLEVIYSSNEIGNLKDSFVVFSNDPAKPHTEVKIEATLVESLTKSSIMNQGSGGGMFR